MKPPKFKMTELGLIPEDWEVKRLGEIGEPLMCKRILKSQTLDAGDVPFYKIGTFGGAADAYISRSLYESYRRKYSYPKKGNVLLSAAGTIGRTVVYDGRDAYFQDSNIVWLDNDESQVLNEYLHWWYKVISWNTEDGGIVTRLYNNNLKSSLIALPPLPEQRRIAGALSDVDELISALGKLIEKKRNIKTGTMQQLLTGKRRLPGFGGKWVEKRLRDVVKIGNGKDYKHLSKGDIPVYGTGGLMTYVNEYLHEGATVCIGRKGTIDEPQYHEGKIWTVDTLFYTYDFNGVDPKFLYYLFTRINWLSYNTATGVPSLTAMAILGIEMSIPSLPEQRAIAAVLSDMDAEIAALEAERAKYARIKSGMMQELLTGRTRLKGE